MTNAIARWHSNARPTASDVEQAYADRLEGEMQELAVRLHQVLCQLSTDILINDLLVSDLFLSDLLVSDLTCH